MNKNYDKRCRNRVSDHCRISCCSESNSNSYNVLFSIILLILITWIYRNISIEIDEQEAEDADIAFSY